MPIVIDHGAMGSTSGDLSGDAGYLQATLDELDAQVKVLAANWSGETQQAYLVAKAKWTESMTQIRETLAQISVLLSETSQSFADIDRKGAAMWA